MLLNSTHMFSWRNKKNINTFGMKKKCLIQKQELLLHTSIACLFKREQKIILTVATPERDYPFPLIFCLPKLALTHFSLETPKRTIGKQCNPRSDTTECGARSGSILIALITRISIKHSTCNKKTNQIPCYWK